MTFAGAFKEILHQVKPTLAENVRFGLSLTPERIARAYAHRGAMYLAHARVPGALRRVRRAGHAGAGVRRRARVPGGDRRRADGVLPRRTSAPARGSPSPRTRRSRCRPGSRRTGCRSGCSSSGRARGEAALLRPRARRVRGDGARGAAAGALGCPGRRRRRRPRTAPRTRTPSRGRSGSLRRAASALCAARRRSRPICASSAAGSRGCGRRCTRRRWTRGATSSCSRPRPRASARRGATAGSASRRLTHGIDNGLARFAGEMEVLERLGLENFDGLRRRSGALRHRLRLRGDRRAARADRRLPGAVDRGGARVAGALRPPRHRARRRGDARRGPLADLHRRRLGPHRRGHARPGQARARPARRGARGGRARVRALGRPRPARRRDALADRRASQRRGGDPRLEVLTRRPAASAPRARPARHERLSPAAARGLPLRRAGLRLRARHGAAERGAARGDRLVGTARASATAATSSTTTA